MWPKRELSSLLGQRCIIWGEQGLSGLGMNFGCKITPFDFRAATATSKQLDSANSTCYSLGLQLQKNSPKLPQFLFLLENPASNFPKLINFETPVWVQFSFSSSLSRSADCILSMPSGLTRPTDSNLAVILYHHTNTSKLRGIFTHFRQIIFVKIFVGNIEIFLHFFVQK